MFAWKENNVCVATYNVLEGDMFLDQFEDVDIPFKDGGEVELGNLRYFPKTTNNPDIIQVLSFEIARKFLKHLTKVFTISKENPESTADIIVAFAGVFADKSKTISELAEEVDKRIKFPDEIAKPAMKGAAKKRAAKKAAAKKGANK
jgi:hypothetical protein